jgi:hypothetical protein
MHRLKLMNRLNRPQNRRSGTIGSDSRPSSRSARGQVISTPIALAGVCALLVALVLVPSGTAGQPVTQTLNPPPPPFLSCKSVGNGTICTGTRSFAYSQLLNDEGGPAFMCGSGANAFVIIDSGIHSQSVKRTYNADGNLTERVIHESFDSTFSNSVTGAAVPYIQHDSITDELAVPGDFNSATETTTGLLTDVVLPHQGTIWLENGKTVIGPDGSLDFASGPNDGNDWQFNGDISVWDPVCSALGAS